MDDFQDKVNNWTTTCFGRIVATDVVERNHRFLEEALELVQSLECTKEEALALVEYVFSREKGDPRQELGGVMVTVNALANANDLDVENCALDELNRCWAKIDRIREKHASKPKFSPLPGK